MAELISVILTTYNREDALAAVLRSLARQSDRQFEVVVADDGSGAATKALLAAWRDRLGVALIHVRHEHRGFRAAEIRNRAILACHGAYCIFLDGDCVVRPDYIATHRRLAERGWFLTGNRALLSTACTATVLADDIAPENWSFAEWIAQRWHGGVNRLGPLLHIPLGPLRKLRPRAWQDARSCNLAVWRSDLDRIDGYDANFSGWGREDSDLIVRLIRSGVRRKDGIFATGVLHLWHPEADRARLAENQHRLDQVIAGDRIRAERGLSAFAADSARGIADGRVNSNREPAAVTRPQD